MKFTANRMDVEVLPVDFLGFIFYYKSKRYVGDDPPVQLFNGDKPKVGVFVDENVSFIFSKTKRYGLNWVQLHGKETPQTCKLIKNQGLKLIKVFNVDESFDFQKTIAYEKVTDYFLFDTKTTLPGGSGKKFNWKILENYHGTTPFFLSGGITSEDATSINKIDHKQLAGIDVNSGFEDSPGKKNIEKLRKFIKEIRSA
ncbi:MAG: N-(5'-phosphoribosyl)anthranilate isomerase [Draconibacterium sp.]|nr:MAG: N-(5'-phosphoribosyl)anthranilate isomerase [Draconibacterium sp.]